MSAVSTSLGGGFFTTCGVFGPARGPDAAFDGGDFIGGHGLADDWCPLPGGGLASGGRLARCTAGDALAGGGIGVSEWVLALAAATKDGNGIESTFGG